MFAAKRALSSGISILPVAKRSRPERQVTSSKIASAKVAAKVDAHPPLDILLNALADEKVDVAKGEGVMYWMRMEDMRILDNRALSLASQRAQTNETPLLVLFVFSPQDYAAHDHGPRKIDFMLRNLRVLKDSFAELHIPLHTIEHSSRHSLPEKVVSLATEWKASHIYANIEYEVDELRRDIKTLELSHKEGLSCVFVHDRCVVPPGTVKTKQNKAYTIYSPWLKTWFSYLQAHPEHLVESPPPAANAQTVRDSPIFSSFFSTPIPASLEGFECTDKQKMEELWPTGTEVAMQILDGFFHTTARKTQIGDSSPLTAGAKTSSRESRIFKYAANRNRIDSDSSSRISPYLSSGVISARECLRRTIALTGKQALEIGRDHGVGMWVQEIAWRDFYMHVLAAFPRCSMGRPYLEKYAGVQWETNEEHLQAWKDGRTGVPIVDAAMRQLNIQGWMHNRSRMIVAMFLSKDLMLDWRLGEKYFMENLIDGDLGSNNGGWQWSASTGVDPQPYFRIFNPLLQSEKADPKGDYIRHFVPELRKLQGKVIHDPYSHLPRAEFEKLGYPKPLVNHAEARDRAIRRYKNVGEL